VEEIVLEHRRPARTICRAMLDYDSSSKGMRVYLQQHSRNDRAIQSSLEVLSNELMREPQFILCTRAVRYLVLVATVGSPTAAITARAARRYYFEHVTVLPVALHNVCHLGASSGATA